MTPATIVRHVSAAAGVVGCLACGHSGIDAAKFDAVRAAALALRTDVGAAAGGRVSHLPELLRAFQAEVAATESRVSGRDERAVLRSYANAADAYKLVLRFEQLEREEVRGMVLLRGANQPAALRYGVPFEERGGGRWVNRKTAMKVFAASADAALSEAARLVGGTRAR